MQVKEDFGDLLATISGKILGPFHVLHLKRLLKLVSIRVDARDFFNVHIIARVKVNILAR